ncbi:hypothetical protein C1H46_025093 [Malus baccata]|uniref:Uncharacterized protein n=1 Tax=Malus baccata TaxID=106549 RepID=A0A540LS50_MALBA|nr:hypothetical protein C1H46_025093 [Malus baccata]
MEIVLMKVGGIESQPLMKTRGFSPCRSDVLMRWPKKKTQSPSTCVFKPSPLTWIDTLSATPSSNGDSSEVQIRETRRLGLDLGQRPSPEISEGLSWKLNLPEADFLTAVGEPDSNLVVRGRRRGWTNGWRMKGRMEKKVRWHDVADEYLRVQVLKGVG